MSGALGREVEDRLFREARTHVAWQDRPVSDELLRQIYDLMRWGPTSANCCPLRIVFVRSREAKARLQPALAPGNLEKSLAAPVCAILANDVAFYEKLPQLFPHTDARAWFVGNEALIEETAMRNGSLQAAYFMLAARMLGLDCGPMSGFDAEQVNAEFFAGSTVRANFLCNLGYGDGQQLHPRGPRLDFAEACRLV